MEKDWWLLLLIGAALLYLLLRPKWWVPNTRLNWATLADLMRNEADVEKSRLVGEDALGADFAIQFRTVGASVKYFRSERGGTTRESLDVFRRGEMGFIVTFYDKKPRVFQRPSGPARNHPEFTPEQETALTGLLDRFRSYAKT